MLAAVAGPTGGTVTSGAAIISTPTMTMTNINQSSQNVSLNWTGFNINGNETVNFFQSNSSAIAVNRILSNDASSILGHLNANGQVILINPNGVLFGEGAQVNVGGLIASGLDMGNRKVNIALTGKRYISGIDNIATSALGTSAGQITTSSIVGLQMHYSL